jgi:hypothetical protein
MSDDADDVAYCPYTPSELETLRRCQKGDPVSDSDLLAMLSMDMQLVEERVHDLHANVPSDGMDEGLWGVLNDLYCQVWFLNECLRRWRASHLPSASMDFLRDLDDERKGKSQ